MTDTASSKKEACGPSTRGHGQLPDIPDKPWDGNPLADGSLPEDCSTGTCKLVPFIYGDGDLAALSFVVQVPRGKEDKEKAIYAEIIKPDGRTFKVLESEPARDIVSFQYTSKDGSRAHRFGAHVKVKVGGKLDDFGSALLRKLKAFEKRKAVDKNNKVDGGKEGKRDEFAEMIQALLERGNGAFGGSSGCWFESGLPISSATITNSPPPVLALPGRCLPQAPSSSCLASTRRTVFKMCMWM